jgi:hypothetical protein
MTIEEERSDPHVGKRARSAIEGSVAVMCGSVQDVPSHE